MSNLYDRIKKHGLFGVPPDQIMKGAPNLPSLPPLDRSKILPHTLSSKGINMLDAMRLKNLIDSNTCEGIFSDPERREAHLHLLPVWFFPLIAYEAPGVPLNVRIIYTYQVEGKKYAIILDGLDEFKGLKDTLLAIPLANEEDKMNFAIFQNQEIPESTHIRLLNWGAVVRIENFPRQRGWYMREPTFGLPLGAAVEDPTGSPDARLLQVNLSGNYVGIPSCGLGVFHSRAFNLCEWPAAEHGALIYGLKSAEKKDG